MLNAARIVAFVATAKPDRALAFYRDTLGLPLLSNDEFAVAFDANGIMLRVTKLREFTPLPFTVLGWQVADLTAALAELRGRGVSFERFPGMQQDRDGAWTAPGGARIAWFKDPDGNLLSVSQD